MPNQVPLILQSLAAVLLAGCALPEGGPAAFTGDAPFAVRHEQVSQNQYYIEVLGNNAAKHPTLATFLVKKADELCPSGHDAPSYAFGNRFPHGRLQDIKMQSCWSGGHCNRTQAAWPLVAGTVNCKQ